MAGRGLGGVGGGFGAGRGLGGFGGGVPIQQLPTRGGGAGFSQLQGGMYDQNTPPPVAGPPLGMGVGRGLGVILPPVQACPPSQRPTPRSRVPEGNFSVAAQPSPAGVSMISPPLRSDPTRQQEPPSPGEDQQGDGEQFNECEIILLEKSSEIEAYTEKLECKVEEVGFTVGIMFPRPGIVLKDFLKGLFRKGTKVSIVIRPENATHQSITLHEVKSDGKIQEHRNMPWGVACEKLKQLKAAAKRSALTFIPEEVKEALESVLEDGFLSDAAYQASVKYLIDRWQKQHDYEGKNDYDEGTGILSEKQLMKKIAHIICGDDRILNPESTPKVHAVADSLIKKSDVLSAISKENGKPAN